MGLCWGGQKKRSDGYSSTISFYPNKLKGEDRIELMAGWLTTCLALALGPSFSSISLLIQCKRNASPPLASPKYVSTALITGTSHIGWCPPQTPANGVCFQNVTNAIMLLPSENRLGNT